MDELFAVAKAISNNAQTTVDPQDETIIQERELLDAHINEVMMMITDGYENNILLSAKRGVNYAFLMIYRADSKVRGIIPLHDLIILSETLDTKFAAFELTRLMDRLQEKFKPFVIKHTKLLDILEKTSPDMVMQQAEHYATVYCITVEWTG